MDKVYFDPLGRELSQLVIGTDYFGTAKNKATAFALLDYYTGRGGNVIDTARMYTGGRSEEIIGEYLKERALRQSVVVSTKCAFPYPDDKGKSRLSLKEIEDDVDASLAALQVDVIDILWVHRDDVKIPTQEIIGALNVIIKKGKALSVGASNWHKERIAEANGYADTHGLHGFCASQLMYTPARVNDVDLGTIVIMDQSEREFYEKTKLPVFAFSSQAKGFFEKINGGCLTDKARQRFYNDDNVRLYAEIKQQASRENRTISAVTLERLIKQSDFPVFPIIGCSSVSQLEGSLG